MSGPRVPATILAALALLVACGPVEDGPPTPAGNDTPEETGEPEPGPEDAATDEDGHEDGDEAAEAPDPPPWEPTDGEVLAEIKQAAARSVETLLTRIAGEGAADAAARVTDDAGLADALAEAIDPIVDAERSGAVEVHYPMMGGLGAGEAAVMVIATHLTWHPNEPAEVDAETRTFDVRVRQQGDDWVLDDLPDIGGEPVERPDDLPAIADEVLDHDGIELPDSARWDIHRGAVAEAVLDVMLRLAERTTYQVGVIESGHPEHVFGTDRRSNHLRGRAVDIYGVGGELVAEQREDGSELEELVRWLYDEVGVTELGSPWALNGPGGRSFTDEVHDDHLHIGYR